MSWFELTVYSIAGLCAVGIVCLPFALFGMIRQMLRENGEREND